MPPCTSRWVASELAWAGWRRGAYLRARHVQFTAPDGAVIANIPALALRVALRALLHGRFAFTRIELVGPLLRLIREPDGRIDLGLGAETEARPENPVAQDLLDALLTPESADAPMAYLRHVEIGDGEVIVEDRASGLALRAPHIHLELERRVGGIAGTVRGDVTLGNQTVSVDSTAQLQADPRALDVQLSFRGFNPAGVAAYLARLRRWLNNIRMCSSSWPESRSSSLVQSVPISIRHCSPLPCASR